MIIPRKFKKGGGQEQVIQLRPKGERVQGLQEAIGFQRNWRTAREMMATEAWRQAPSLETDIKNAQAVLAGEIPRWAPNLEHHATLQAILETKCMFFWRKIWGKDSSFLMVQHSDHEVRGYRTEVNPLTGEHTKYQGDANNPNPYQDCFIIKTSYGQVILELLRRWDQYFCIPGEIAWARARWERQQREEGAAK